MMLTNNKLWKTRLRFLLVLKLPNNKDEQDIALHVLRRLGADVHATHDVDEQTNLQKPHLRHIFMVNK